MFNPKDYKTTAAAMITAAAGYVLMFPEDFQGIPHIVHLCKFAGIGGLAAFGIFAKDSIPVTPTSDLPVSPNPPKVVPIDRNNVNPAA